MLSRIALFIVTTVMLLLAPEGAEAAAITVSTTADVVADDGLCSLREAITAANNNAASGSTVGECAAGTGTDTISLTAGTHTLALAGADENGNATGDLDIQGNVIISGAGSGNTIIDGGALDRVLDIISGSFVEIDGLAITNGITSSGGGILNSGTLVLTNSTITGNTADLSGGIYNSGSLTMTKSTVKGNTALTAGGIFNTGTLTLNNSTVSNNTSTGATTNTGPGGGIMNIATTTLVNSSVSGNTAGPGHTGGGIFNCVSACGATTTSLVLIGSTVTGNSAVLGGGIHNGTGGIATLANTIIANSVSGGDCAGSLTSLGHNLDSDGTCGLGATGDISDTDPLLGPLQDNGGPTDTHAL